MSIGKRIREIRGDLPRSEFADRIGVSPRSLERWEQDDTIPIGSALLKMRQNFGTDINWLLTGDRFPAEGSIAHAMEIMGEAQRHLAFLVRSGMSENTIMEMLSLTMAALESRR